MHTTSHTSANEWPARFSSSRVRMGQDDDMVTYDQCSSCGGRINNNSIARSRGAESWVHSNREDWVDNVHQAVPEGGPVTDRDIPVDLGTTLDYDSAASRLTFRSGDWPVLIGGRQFHVRAVTLDAVARRPRTRRQLGHRGFELERVEDGARFVWIGDRNQPPPDAKLESDAASTPARG